MKFQSAADRYLRQVRKRGGRESTVRAYAKRLRHLAQLSDLDVRDVTADQLLDVLDSVPERSRPAVLQVARGVLQAGGATPPQVVVRIDKPSTKVLNAAQCRKLRERLLAEGPKDPAADVLAVLLGSGARLGEVLACRSLVEGDPLGLAVESADAKGRRGRVVDLPSWCEAPARRLVGITREQRVAERTVRRRLGEVLEALRLPAVRVHDLRHSRITELLLEGAPVAWMASQAGHVSPGYMLARYAHASAATKAQRKRWVEGSSE